MNVFLDKVAAVLEVSSVTPDTDFRTVEGWCSLMAFGLLVMLEQQYGKTLAVEDFQTLRTVADLASAAGIGGPRT